MNFRLDVAGLTGEGVGLAREGIVCETVSGQLRFRKPGLDAEWRVTHRDVGGVERSIGLAADHIVEVTAPPTWSGLGNTVKLLRTSERVDPWRLDLFRQCGEMCIEPVPRQEHADEVVCECKGITKSELVALLGPGVDRAAIGAACGAGTVCGGCTPLIDALTGHGSTTAADLIEVDRLGDGNARFRFRYLSPVELADEPGAHVFVQAVVEGRVMTRPYTVVAITSDDCLDIIVKREPGGVFSGWLHDHAASDGAFRLSLPQATARPSFGGRAVFIAAGIGITPAFAYMAAAGPASMQVHWSLRGSRSSPLATLVRAAAERTGCSIAIRDTSSEGRAGDWGALYPADRTEAAIVCGPLPFQDAVVADLVAAGWDRSRITIENFGPRRSREVLQHVDSFDYVQNPVVADSFHLAPIASVSDEAYAFLRQFYFEHGAPAAFNERWAAVSSAIELTGTYVQTFEELAFGARLAWRNAARCIGRFFWKSLHIRDYRHLDSEEQIFAAIVSHLDEASNAGDIKPLISIFRAGEPRIRILNPQLILYAGHRKPDGSVVGDPKNVELTDLAMDLGWRGAGTRFDVLPVVIQIGEATPRAFVLPRRVVLEVALTHPRNPSFADLGLRWFAVPAVSGMALDVGGIQYPAAPSNGFYMSTEIGSLNLADPARYDETARVAKVMGLDTTGGDPLWRDQAMLDLNVAVLHSFTKAGVRILDHHSMSAYFVRFREAEALAKRPSYGHWAWVMPPMGGNLSPTWRDNTLQKKILKPNYFYQSSAPAAEVAAARQPGCPLRADRHPARGVRTEA